jgi:hypothetical protein
MIIDDLKSEIGNLNGASRRLASIVTAIAGEDARR